MKDRSRSYICMVDIRSEKTELEVDVSSTKLEVKFRDMEEIFTFIGSQISKLLM